MHLSACSCIANNMENTFFFFLTMQLHALRHRATKKKALEATNKKCMCVDPPGHLSK